MRGAGDETVGMGARFRQGTYNHLADRAVRRPKDRPQQLVDVRQQAWVRVAGEVQEGAAMLNQSATREQQASRQDAVGRQAGFHRQADNQTGRLDSGIYQALGQGHRPGPIVRLGQGRAGSFPSKLIQHPGQLGLVALAAAVREFATARATVGSRVRG